MKKIPTLFTRVFEDHKVVKVLDDITPGCEEAFKNGTATIKCDGACCAVIDGVFYKRYDAKNGKTPPEGAIPCCDPDPITGHWPHWVKVDANNPTDKWFIEAMSNTYPEDVIPNPGTYEAVGPHFNGNPYHLVVDELIPHGLIKTYVGRTFNDIKDWLEHHNEEGLVFWLHDEPVCKIKRSDFGLKWPMK
jgi:hypothetical protein